jgi:hypothetical protein
MRYGWPIKYVMLDKIHPVIFLGIKHADAAERHRITSAGFFVVGEGTVETAGDSLSLGGLAPAPHDAELIQHFLERGGLL